MAGISAPIERSLFREREGEASIARTVRVLGMTSFVASVDRVLPDLVAQLARLRRHFARNKIINVFCKLRRVLRPHRDVGVGQPVLVVFDDRHVVFGTESLL